MANRFKQPKLPWTNQDVEDAIEKRLGDLKKLDQEFHGVKTDAKSIRQRLTLQSAGEYPDSDDEDPTVDAAHKKSVDLVQEHKRLMREVPVKASELRAMQAEADDKKVIMDKILSDGSPNSINADEVMKMKIPEDKMMIMVQAVTTYHGSLDFLRSIGSEHRQLLLTKEAEIAGFKRSQLEDVGDEVIPSTLPEIDHRSAPERKAQEFADVQSARSKAEDKAKELERQVADLEKRLADEQEASAGAQKSLRQEITENKDALKGKVSALEQQEIQLAASETTVARLQTETGKLREKVTELEHGIIANAELMDELEESRSEVERLKEQVEKMLPDASDKSRLEEELAGQQEQLDTVNKENEDLRQELQGKAGVLEACNEAKDSAQRLADGLQAELAQKKGELQSAVSLREKTAELYKSSSRELQNYRSDYHHELSLRQATYDELLAEQAKVKSKEGEIKGLGDSIKSKDEEIRALHGSIKSKDEEIRSLQDSVKSKEDEIQVLQGSLKSKEDEVQGLHDSIKSKDEEIRGLQDSVKSKEDEAQGFKATIESTEESLRLANDNLEQLTTQIRDRDEQLQSQNESVAELRAKLDNVGREQADTELDLRFVIRLSNLGIRPVDAGLPEWTSLLRSLRVSDPVEVTPDEDKPRQTWAILPSWPGPETSEGTGTGSSCLHSSLDGLLFELYGHGVAEGDFPCDQCLQAICTLSALVERQGVVKVGPLVLVLEKLEARLRGLQGASLYEGMVMLGLRYLAALVRSRVSGVDIPGLASVEDGLDGMMRQTDKCLGVIRHVSDGLCSSGGIETVEASQGLRLTSREGRVLVLLAGSGCVGRLFLLADPQEKTVRAVSFHRLNSRVSLSEACEVVHSTVIKAPAGQSDIELDPTAAEADWIQENM